SAQVLATLHRRRGEDERIEHLDGWLELEALTLRLQFRRTAEGGDEVLREVAPERPRGGQLGVQLDCAQVEQSRAGAFCECGVEARWKVLVRVGTDEEVPLRSQRDHAAPVS